MVSPSKLYAENGNLGERTLCIVGGMAAILVLLCIVTFTMAPGVADDYPSFGIILFDNRVGATPPYPFTIQNLTWIIFGGALGELMYLLGGARREADQLYAGLLPEEEDIMHDRRALAEYARSIQRSGGGIPFRLQKVLQRTIWQFQSTGSISQTTEVMNASLELCHHDLDLRYSLTRYFVWVIPTIGFIGTVWGISNGLSSMIGLSPTQENYREMIDGAILDLGVAFSTTLLALVLSGILVLLQQMVQDFDEKTLNRTGQYVIDNLINKIVE